MKIVFSTTIYLPHIGGIEIYIHEIAQYLIKNGHTVSVIVADKYCDNVKEEVISDEKVIRLPAREIGGFFFLKDRRHLELVSKEIRDADVVHVNVSKFLFDYFAKQKGFFNYRLVATSHGWLYHTQKYKLIKDIYFKRIIVRYAPMYDGIINVSYQDQEIAHSFGVKDSTVILNGVDCYKYSGLKPKKEFEAHFMYWGRISQNKGIYECLKKLSKYRHVFRFDIIGKCEDKTYEDRLDQLIKENDMSDKVRFLGTLSDDEIREILEKTDIIMMPSLHEGFGMTLVECLLSGRPIIANTNDSYRYILQCTQAEEYLFDFEDESTDINTKIEQLIEKKVSPKNVEQFSAENMIKKTLAVYGI